MKLHVTKNDKNCVTFYQNRVSIIYVYIWMYIIDEMYLKHTCIYITTWSMIFSQYSGFLHDITDIVESGIKHHKPNPRAPQTWRSGRNCHSISTEVAGPLLQSEIKVALFLFASRSFLANYLRFMIKLIDKAIVINVKIQKNERNKGVLFKQ